MKKALTVCLAMMMMAVLPGGTLASSVWLANGVTTDTGGTLVGFNRDSRPDGQQLMWIKPDSGFSYFALFAPDLFDNRQPVIGVNQAGLLVASLPVITIPVVYRQDMTYNHNLIRQILRQCGTVDDLQQHGDWLVGPQTLVVADGRQAAIIEIGPDGKYSQQTVKDGVAGHTDHYLLPDMVQFNQRNNKQSTARYQLLTAMLGRSGRWTLDDFAQIGQYQSDRDGTASLFRVGNRAGAERTTASWAVSLTPGKMPEVSIMMLDDQQNEQNWYINTGYIFSGDSQFAAGSEPPLTNDGSR